MINDLRHAIRFLFRNPGFTLPALTVLSLEIGLNVTVFSIVNLLLFKAPPVGHPAALIWITGRPAGSEPAPENLSYPDLVDLGRNPAMSGVTGFAPARLAITAGARSARVAGEIVPGNYFQVLGITTAAGRLLTPDDDRPAIPGGVAIIGDALWQRLFDRRLEAIGHDVLINGERLTVAGVAPRGFAGFDVLSPAEIWIPVSAAARVGAVPPLTLATSGGCAPSAASRPGARARPRRWRSRESRRRLQQRSRPRTSPSVCCCIQSAAPTPATGAACGRWRCCRSCR